MSDDLTPTEHEMLAAFAVGNVAGDARGGPYAADTMRSWGPERTVRAQVVRGLLVSDDATVAGRGVSISGMRISGALDLTDAHIRRPLVLWRCLLDQPLALSGTTVSRLYLGECRLPSVAADGLVATSGVGLTACVVDHGISIADGHINGTLDCSGTVVGMDAAGDSIAADRIIVNGIFLGDIETRGAIRLHSAQVSGPITLKGARLGADKEGASLVADGLVVRGNVGLRSVYAAGSVRLPTAEIDGELNCRGASIVAADDDGALVAIGMSVGRDVLLNGGFRASGRIHLRSARIGGSLLVHVGTTGGPTSFFGAGAQVEHEFAWRAVGSVSSVNLERMRVGRLTDDWTRPDGGWPEPGGLRLIGFTYDSFGSNATVGQRLDWVRRQQPFSMQPYEQLARVYRDHGNDTDARTVAIAGRNDLRRYGELTRPRRAGSWLLDKTVKHGYQPLRAAGFLAALYVVLLVTFWHAQHREAVVVPTKDTTATALHCGDDYPCFYPATYALDLVVPILDVPGTDAWRTRGGTYVATGVAASALGWAFSTLAVLGYTGIVRKQ